VSGAVKVRGTGWDRPVGVRDGGGQSGGGLVLEDGCACPRDGCGGTVRVAIDRAWCTRKISAGGCGSEWVKSRRERWTPPKS
jgi:hypothetical protein